MNWITGRCDYCQKPCSNDKEDGDKLPYLYDMVDSNIPFIRRIVCGDCLHNIRKYQSKFLEKVALGKIKDNE